MVELCEMGGGSGNEGGARRDSNGGKQLQQHDQHQHDQPRGVVCRDFLRSICRRGSACKFNHPDSSRKKVYSFCHDYQNGGCRRSSHCRFIHSGRQDEIYYKRMGELPPHLSERYENRNASSPEPDNMVPLCKEYLWSKCWRDNCKFRHVSISEYRKIQRKSPSPPVEIGIEDDLIYDNRRRPSLFDSRRIYPNEIYEPELKRRRVNYMDDIPDRASIVNPVYENGDLYECRPQPDRAYLMLEEENMMLRARVGELKKRVDDLQATNEFLLEQNAQLRISDKSAAAGLTTVTVPAVTITNTPQMQQAPTPQQMVNAAIRTVTASVATVPVSLAAVTPVSIAAVSMAPVQQMPPPVVTMAQQGAPPPPNPQQGPISISAPTASLVSYPIMSRPVIQTDLRR